MGVKDFTATDYYSLASAPITSYPLCISAWLYWPSASTNEAACAVWLGQASSSDRFAVAAVGQFGTNFTRIQAVSRIGSTTGAETTADFTEDAWFHYFGWWPSFTERNVQTDDGSDKNQNTVDMTGIGTPTLLRIGRRGDGTPAPWDDSCGIAEVSIWTGTGSSANDEALGDLLATGDNPLNLDETAAQPYTGKLVSYWTLETTSATTDQKGANDLTVNGTLANFGSHPTIDAYSGGGGERPRVIFEMAVG